VYKFENLISIFLDRH